MRFKDLTSHQQKLLQQLPDDSDKAVLCRNNALRTVKRLVELGLARERVAPMSTFELGMSQYYRLPAGKRLCKPALEVGRHYTASVTTARIVRSGKLKITATLDTGETFSWYVNPHGDK